VPVEAICEARRSKLPVVPEVLPMLSVLSAAARPMLMQMA
jgi:hypothetical protein